MPQTIIELLNNAAKANYADNSRKQNVICLPANGNLIVTGDIHGHRRNFERIVSFADLDNNPETHVVLHEIIHGGPQDAHGGCLSYKLLFDVARFKLRFPNQVHIILGNHATAFINNSDVMKAGKEMNRAFRAALEREFEQNAGDIIQAIRNFLLSLALAVKCPNRIWISHSLPADKAADDFDPEIFNRPITETDLQRPGSAYLLTWGRRHSQQLLDKLASLLDVDLFVLGHQPQEKGFAQAGDNLLIIASDHNHGCILEIDLTESYTIRQLVDSVIPLTSIA
ncbi:MAG: metallophosphoesterase [Sedimentisphaerales bacterium]|nr:metallophosphoesterase [Sedimentisphaerales bacterium]